MLVPDGVGGDDACACIVVVRVLVVAVALVVAVVDSIMPMLFSFLAQRHSSR